MKVTVEIVHRLNQLGISIEQISIATKLSCEEIQRMLTL